ncbi:MAG: hypothetical protein ACRCTA_06840 [Bacilli bacterium]
MSDHNQSFVLLLAPKAKFNDFKKSLLILKTLIKHDKYVFLVNTSTYYHEIVAYLQQMNYTKYRLIFADNLKDKMKSLYNERSKFKYLIIVGLAYQDHLTSYLEDYIGYDYQLLVVASAFNWASDATNLINDGALLLNRTYDLISL